MVRQEFLGLHFDCLDLDDAASFVVSGDAGDRFRYVVTPNVDHVVRINESDRADVRAAYAAADLCICDSRVLSFLARLRGVRLTTVPGSDLTTVIIPKRVPPATRILLIGGSPATFELLEKMLPGNDVRHYSPPMRLLDDHAAIVATVDVIDAAQADLTLLAVGSPQQEIIAHLAALGGNARGTALCIGAGIEFLVGTKRRAPVLWQSLGLEWLHRLISEPRRLWRRYLIRSPRIFLLLARWRPQPIAYQQ